VSRAGASSLAEIAAMRLPSLLVPFPAAADNHQFYNAAAFANSGAARCLEQKNSTPEKTAAMLAELMESQGLRASISAALEPWHAPKAAAEIAEGILAAITLQRDQAAAKTCSCGRAHGRARHAH
jgi:UDP-N-acetylglucosamine--N-acetylmuramyl-(pentapeptide) pyrophosphoryl-undecaprenol N-acetylglucosamine transferase